MRLAADDSTAHQLASEFRDRLDMLEESNQLTRSARKAALLCLAEISKAVEITLTEDNAAPFVTHVAVALTRLERGEDPVAVSGVVEEEVADRTQERSIVASAMRRCGDLLGIELPDSEISFITVHLCAVVDDA
jgi:transcriptional regulatory protein LevR